MREIAAFIFIMAIAIYLIASYVSDNQILKRKKLIYNNILDKNATIVKTDTELIGSKRNKHYILKIRFSDGSTYQDECSIQKNGYLQYTVVFDKDRVPTIMADAIEAHRKACEQKNK